MKKRTVKFLSLALVLVMVLGLFAGCGKKTESAPAAPEANAAPPAPTNATIDMTGKEIAEKDELIIGYPTGIESTTPFRNNIAQDAPFFRQLYESLAILDRTKGEFVPWCATGWETSDGLVYDVEIYDYITDAAGNKITADDIVWFIQTSMERGLKPAFAKIATVEKTGDYAFRVTMKTDMVGAFETCMVNTFVISKAAFEASGDEFATKPVTTSAYEVTAFTPSSDIVMEKRSDYWQKEELMPAQTVPNVKKVTYKIIIEASQQGVALETGVVDAFIQMDSTTAVNYVNNPEYLVELSEGPQGWTLFFSGHESRPVSNDPNLCNAINYCLDIDGMSQALTSGYSSKMYDVCPSGALGYNPKWAEEPYFDYDVEKAKQLLAESNYNGETLEILVSSATFTQRLAQMIQGSMMNIGINCELIIGDTAFISATRLDGSKYDMFINTIGADYLASHWSIRYDMNAYKTGDGTSRHDQTLTDMLYSTWTNAGYTEENIDKVHYYLMDNGVARGLLNPNNFCIVRADANLVNRVIGQSGYSALVACEYAK